MASLTLKELVLGAWREAYKDNAFGRRPNWHTSFCSPCFHF